MAFTIINTQAAHNAYEQMTIDEQAAIDKAFTAAQKALAENGIGQLANDDRAWWRRWPITSFGHGAKKKA